MTIETELRDATTHARIAKSINSDDTVEAHLTEVLQCLQRTKYELEVLRAQMSSPVRWVPVDVHEGGTR